MSEHPQTYRGFVQMTSFSPNLSMSPKQNLWG